MNDIQTLQNFTIDNLPDLDVAVRGALALFSKTDIPAIDTTGYLRPLVVGSGNAEATGRILFEKTDAIFASESNYQTKLENIPAIDGVVLISASGGKHAPLIAQTAQAAGKPVTLITNTPDSAAFVAMTEATKTTEYVLPKNREPYTYNTSTYMGMILGNTGEQAQVIDDFLSQQIDTLNFPDFADYDKYYLIVPAQFSGIIRMLQVKFIELFGRNIARDVETDEYVRHATTVAPSKELFINFGEPNQTWGNPQDRLNVPLPDGGDYGSMMAVGYYLVAQIQKAQPDYFKANIAAYTTEVSKIFGQEILPIVD